MDVEAVVKQKIPVLLQSHKVRLQGDEGCRALITAIENYLLDLLGDTQDYIERQLEIVGQRKFRSLEKTYEDWLHKVCLIYCQTYVDKVEINVLRADGWLVCGDGLHDPNILRISWDESYHRLTGQGPKKPHGGRRRRYIISFPFRKAG